MAHLLLQRVMQQHTSQCLGQTRHCLKARDTLRHDPLAARVLPVSAHRVRVVCAEQEGVDQPLGVQRRVGNLEGTAWGDGEREG